MKANNRVIIQNQDPSAPALQLRDLLAAHSAEHGNRCGTNASDYAITRSFALNMDSAGYLMQAPAGCDAIKMNPPYSTNDNLRRPAAAAARDPQRRKFHRKRRAHHGQQTTDRRQ
jgi:hypothetical protein